MNQEKSVLLFVLMMICCVSLSAQAPVNNKALKVYTNALFERQSRIPINIPGDTARYDLQLYQHRVGYFTPAFMWTATNGNAHEVEISRVSFGSSQLDSAVFRSGPDQTGILISGTKMWVAELAFRYEYQLFLRKSKPDAALKPYLGFAGQPFFAYHYTLPAQTSEFPFSFLDLGIVLSAVPRLVYDFKERWFVDLNIPIPLYRYQWTLARSDNPQIPVEERTNYSSTAQTFPPLFHVRLDCGLRF